MPADVQDASLAPHMKGVQSFQVGLYKGPSFRAESSMGNTHVEYMRLRSFVGLLTLS